MKYRVLLWALLFIFLSDSPILAFTAHVKVVGTNSLPVYMATVSLRSGSGVLLGTDFTDSLGWADILVSAGVGTVSIKASKGSDSLIVDSTFTAENSRRYVRLAATEGSGWEERIAALFIHQSVGMQMLALNSNILTTYIDTMREVVGNHFSRIVLRNLYTNNATACLSDTSDMVTFLPNTSFDWNTPYPAAFYHIAEVGNSSPQLDLLWRLPASAKATSKKWKLLTDHYIPLPSGDSLFEHYDIIIQKPPYHAWDDPTAERMSLLRSYMREMLDTLGNHPEVYWVFSNGSPFVFEEGGDRDFESDTSQAALVYGYASWFASDSFFVHSDTGLYRHVWKWDSYRPLCYSNEGNPHRYCLRDEWWDGSGSHLNKAGAQVGQDSLASIIRTVTHDIMLQRYQEILVDEEVAVGGLRVPNWRK